MVNEAKKLREEYKKKLKALQELSDEEEVAVLLSKMFKHMYSFIEERGLMSEYAKWTIHNRNEVIIDLVRLGSVFERLIEEAEG